MQEVIFQAAGPETIIAEGVTVGPVIVHGEPMHLVKIGGEAAVLKPTAEEALEMAGPQIRRHVARHAADRIRTQAWCARMALQAACAHPAFTPWETAGRCLRERSCIACGKHEQEDSSG